MKAYRAALLWFAPPGEGKAQAHYEEDGLLVVGPDAQGAQVVQAIGSWSALREPYASVPVTHFPGRIIAPGFVDLHVHFPQTNIIGAPADGLLPWLEKYTFPEEQRFADPDYSASSAAFFLDELLRNGVTSSLVFATSNPTSVNALFAEAQARSLRLITGLCLMDQNAPAALCNAPGPVGVDGTEQSLRDTEALIQRWRAPVGWVTPSRRASCPLAVNANCVAQVR